ncbi:RHS repeat-associated core domain-containing protein [Xenorhabdus sp. IM139775]|uniref:RHS repeat-associated core domain-containing protein n=1 Tax=Xenorhabdus sp. IM139775 TaxID=3025876 RepID=UPI002358A937|nr:RHS repeat-associated core domain-containing protein [Xenorhabdus sp. IM139775]MDC9592525.1 hypothetical protein [Xenorhabdus sp. IM139775]
MTGYQDVAGNCRQVSFDQYGRPVAASDPAIDIALTYDAASRVKRWQVHDKPHDRRLTTTVDFDDFGREVSRQIQTGSDTLTLEQGYTVNGQVASRTTRSQQAGLLRQETYGYDPARYWLVAYDCTGAECPRDAYGFSLAGQRFTYDVLGNMLTCTTTLADGSRDTATFAYSPSDPCQLQTVTHTHPRYPATVTLAYDAAGRLIQDEAGRRLTYDALGRLAAIHQGESAGTYGYDAADRLVLQHIGTGNTHELYYQGAARVAEIVREQGTVTRLLQAHGTTVATVTGAETHVLGTDNHGSVLVNQHGDGTETRYRYSPYGQQDPAEQGADIPAYNGERLDPLAGGYHLGNGYRAYNPVLMRFNAPDSESPFGAGGINAYAYCLGDPINRMDPTGHMSWGGIFGIVLGAIGLVVGIALAIPTGGASLSVSGAIIAGVGALADITGIASAATEDSNPQASAVLGWVSLGLGVASLGAIGAVGIANGLQRLGRRLTGAFGEGLSGRGAAGSSLASHSVSGSNDYEIAFRHAMSDNRIMQIENPVGSGIYTVGLETNGLLPEGGEVEYLRRALFRPRGDNSTIEIVNNTTTVGQVSQVPFNISNEDFEKLYLPFISTGILNTRDISSSVTNIVTGFRHIVLTNIRNVSEFNVSTMNIMKNIWGRTDFSRFSVNEWLYHELRYLSPDLNFPQNILLDDNAFQFFNQTIIQNIRGLNA